MSDSLLHFPLYIGDTLKKFIQNPSLEERGAWISIAIAIVHNDGELPDEDSLYRYALCFDEKDKQSLSKALAKLKQDGSIDEIKLMINKQKNLRKSRQDAGRKGGKKSKKNKQSLSKGVSKLLKQNVSNSESESESESNTELEPIKDMGANVPLTLTAKFGNPPIFPLKWKEDAMKERSVREEVVDDWLEDFAQYWQKEEKTKKGKKVNWDATWRNWYRGQRVAWDVRKEQEEQGYNYDHLMEKYQ